MINAQTKYFKDITASGIIRIGTNPASAGIIRLQNKTTITARNSTNTGDIDLIGSSNANHIFIGGSVIDIGTSNVINLIYSLSIIDSLIHTDQTGADTTLIYDDGTNFNIESDNPINISSSTSTITGDLVVTGDATVDTLTPSTLKTPYQQTIIVAKSGGDYAVIQDAIDGITDATANKKYTILIYSGVYTENIVGENHVNLKGMGAGLGQAEITAATGTVLTTQTTGNCVYSNLKISATGTAECMNIPVGSTSELKFQDVAFTATYSSRVDDAITINSGKINMRDCRFIYTETGAATVTVTHRMINVVACTSVKINGNSSAIIDIDDTNANNFEFFKLTSGADCSADIIIPQTDLDLEIAGTGCIIADYDTDGTTDRTFRESHVDIDVVGTALIYKLDNVVVHWRGLGNKLHLTGATKYVADIGNAATLTSNFSDITGVTVESETSGTGTYSQINSPDDDVFSVSGDMHAKFIEFDDDENTYIGLDKTYPSYFTMQNDETNIWLGNAADVNIAINFEKNSDIIAGYGTGGDTDIILYEGLINNSTLGQTGVDFSITNNTTNGDIDLAPNGTGTVDITGGLEVVDITTLEDTLILQRHIENTNPDSVLSITGDTVTMTATVSFGDMTGEGANEVTRFTKLNSDSLNTSYIYNYDAAIVTVDDAINYGADTESSDTYVVTITGITAYQDGLLIIFEANTTNTGACTVNVNTLGAIDLKAYHDQDPPDNYIESGSMVMCIYDGTNFQLQSPDCNP